MVAGKDSKDMIFTRDFMTFRGVHAGVHPHAFCAAGSRFAGRLIVLEVAFDASLCYYFYSLNVSRAYPESGRFM
jgi:hypothetical protein